MKDGYPLIVNKYMDNGSLISNGKTMEGDG